MGDRPFAEAATFKTQHTQEKTSMPSAGFELMIPAVKWPQTCALDRAATEISGRKFTSRKLIKFPLFNCDLKFSEATDAVQFVPHGKSSGGICFRGTAVRDSGLLVCCALERVV